jgi:spore germination protein KB
MKQIQKINARQMTIFVIFYFIGSTILITPATLAAGGKQDAWISAIIGVIVSLFFVWFYTSIAKLYPEKNFIEYLEIVLGKWVGKVVSMLYILFFILSAAGSVWIIGDFMTTQVMPATPAVVFHIAFTMVVIFGVRWGIEVLARSAEIFFFWFIVLLLFFILFLLADINVENITPIFENGFHPIVQASLYFISISGVTMFTFLLILPSARNAQFIRKTMMIGTLFGGMVLVVITFLCISVLGPTLTEYNVYPTYALAKKVNLGNFLERIEVIIAGIFMVTIFIKTTLYFYAIMISLAQTFRMKDYRPLVFPVGMWIVILSLVIYPSSIYAENWNSNVWIPFVFTFGFVFPIIVWGIGKWKARKRKEVRN